MKKKPRPTDKQRLDRWQKMLASDGRGLAQYNQKFTLLVPAMLTVREAMDAAAMRASTKP